MANRMVRLLQLIYLDHLETKHIQVRFSFLDDQDNKEFTWLLDSFTFEQMNQHIDIHKHEQYRLSFQFRLDPIKNRYTTSLTRVHGDRSEKLFFLCSEAYIEQLSLLKSIDSFDELHQSIYQGIFDPKDQIIIEPEVEPEPERIESEPEVKPERIETKVEPELIETETELVSRVVSVEKSDPSLVNVPIQTSQKLSTKWKIQHWIKPNGSIPHLQIPNWAHIKTYVLTNSTRKTKKKSSLIKVTSYVTLITIALLVLVGYQGWLSSAQNMTGEATGTYIFPQSTASIVYQSFNLLSDSFQMEQQRDEDESINEQIEPIVIDTQDDSNIYTFANDKRSAYQLPTGKVALTFDDGPSLMTIAIVDLLHEHNVSATFFFVGENMLSFPEIVKYTLEKGMQVANHSWSHAYIPRINEELQDGEILKVNQLFSDMIGYAPRLYRPPYGASNARMHDLLYDEGMIEVMWNRDPQDWKVGHSQEILDYFYATEPSGGIYVMHESALTYEVLEDIILHLQEQELEIVSLQ